MEGDAAIADQFVPFPGGLPRNRSARHRANFRSNRTRATVGRSPIFWRACASGWAFGIGSVPRNLVPTELGTNRFFRGRNRATSVSGSSVRFRYLPKEPKFRDASTTAHSIANFDSTSSNFSTNPNINSNKQQ